jgi:hypothetical protein
MLIQYKQLNVRKTHLRYTKWNCKFDIKIMITNSNMNWHYDNYDNLHVLWHNVRHIKSYQFKCYQLLDLQKIKAKQTN